MSQGAIAIARQQEIQRQRESEHATQLAIAQARQVERETAERAAFEAKVAAERARTAREAELAPYLSRVRAAIIDRDAEPLAEELCRLDRAVRQLTERLDAIEHTHR